VGSPSEVRDYEQIGILENTSTTTTISNAKTNGTTTGSEPSILKATIAGVETELVASVVTGSATLENKKDPVSGEHWVSSTPRLVYSSVEVAKPAGKGCKVFKDEGGVKGSEGVIETTALSATSKEQVSHLIKLAPAAGTAFATFFVECTTKVAALEGTWEVTGSVLCPAEGAVVLCSHAETTAQGTLKAKGNKAGLAGRLTIEGKDPDVQGDVCRPLSFKTVETP
jgi:hypothetical protein